MEGEPLLEMFVDWLIAIDGGALTVSAQEFTRMPAVAVDAWRILGTVRRAIDSLEKMEHEPPGG